MYDITPVDADGFKTCPMPSPTELENMALDDLAGIMEHWARNRKRGVTPIALRRAALDICNQLAEGQL